MIIDEKDLLPITANDLKEGFTFYIKQDNGEFERCVCDPAWQSNRGHLAAYRQWVVKLSKEGKLFRRRDIAFEDFRNVEKYNGLKRS
jgi:hypothetical protein